MLFAALVLTHCNKRMILCTAWKSWGLYSCWFYTVSLWQIRTFKRMQLWWMIVCSFQGQLRLVVHTAGFLLNWVSALSWHNLFFSVHSSGMKDTTIKAAKINNVVSWAVNPPKKSHSSHHHMQHSTAHSLDTHTSLFWTIKGSGFRCLHVAAGNMLYADF